MTIALLQGTDASVRRHPLLVEGLLLFFPVAALHAMLSPLIWTTLFVFALPYTHAIPSHQWHAHEMIFAHMARHSQGS